VKVDFSVIKVPTPFSELTTDSGLVHTHLLVLLLLNGSTTLGLHTPI
jgi:hypothetical protein